MTENEALERHKKDCGRCRYKACMYGVDCLQKKDMEAYKELLAYQAIGTVEEFKVLKLKEHNYDNCHNITCRRKCQKDGYNEAIDEFVESINDGGKYIFDDSIGYVIPGSDIEEIAEQLKGGAT